ncbi:hypothetical protein JXA02_09550 [candidate division KSB1 bacterium]|nr:hypothetical protein [candidate division KSB1 bacterium]RQW04331.1 MAG: hypothetical protein EH222_11330 [candidate division KSB1 bacterium]
MNAIWTAVIVVIVTASDALRDRWVVRQVGWWQWHIVKWIAFYPPLVVLTVRYIPWIYWIPLVAVCWILWRVLYRLEIKSAKS